MLALGACRHDEPSEPMTERSPGIVTPNEAPGRGISELHFEVGDTRFAGSVPPELNYVSSYNAELRKGTGEVCVSVGKEFSFTVVRESVSIKELREDVGASDLFEIVFFGEGDDAFFYEAVLPDGRSAGHHYIRCIEVGGNRYVARTDERRQHGYFVTQLAAHTINSLQIVN